MRSWRRQGIRNPRLHPKVRGFKTFSKGFRHREQFIVVLEVLRVKSSETEFLSASKFSIRKFALAVSCQLDLCCVKCKAILALLIETNDKKNTFCIICGRTGHLVSYRKRTYYKRKDMRCLIPRLVQKPTTLTALRDSTPPAPIVAGVPFAQVVREYTNGGMNTLHVRKHETEIMCNQQKTNLQNTYSEHSMPGQGPRPQWCY